MSYTCQNTGAAAMEDKNAQQIMRSCDRAAHPQNPNCSSGRDFEAGNIAAKNSISATVESLHVETSDTLPQRACSNERGQLIQMPVVPERKRHETASDSPEIARRRHLGLGGRAKKRSRAHEKCGDTYSLGEHSSLC